MFTCKNLSKRKMIQEKLWSIGWIKYFITSSLDVRNKNNKKIKWRLIFIDSQSNQWVYSSLYWNNIPTAKRLEERFNKLF